VVEKFGIGLYQLITLEKKQPDEKHTAIQSLKLVYSDIFFFYSSFFGFEAEILRISFNEEGYTV